MNQVKVISHTFLTLVSAFVINKASFAEPVNLSQITSPASITQLKTEIITYHDSGEYIKEVAVVAEQARQYINSRADANNKSSHPQQLAIVLDIDDTTLSNYEHMVERDFSADSAKIHASLLEADAPAIEPMLVLYNDAIAHNVTVFFVTGRNDSELAATKKNLEHAGYQGYKALYIKPMPYPHSSAVPFKSATRAAITKQGYTIIASIGDQYSDLAGGYAEKTYKLPNPYYYLP